MTRTRVALLLGAVACAGVLGVVAHGVRDPEPPRAAPVAPATATPAESARLTDEVHRLQLQVAQQGRQIAAARPGHPEEPPPPEPETRAEQERKRREYMATVEAQFRDERVESSWSAATETAIRSAMAAADSDLRAQARSVECRAQTCRVELASDGADKATAMFLHHIGPALPHAQMAYQTDAGGNPTTILYLARPTATAQQ